MRLQLALNVENLKTAIDFYTKMFGVPPAKIKQGYANFAVQDPPLKLVLFENQRAQERLNHLGVEAFDQDDVSKAKTRFEQANLRFDVQEDVDCCHAQQSKVWAQEPDGTAWEWYRVIKDLDELSDESASCTPGSDGVTEGILCSC